MKRITTRILLASALLLTITALSFAQAQPQWKVGDRIEVRNMSAEWVRASIVGIVDWRDAGRGFGYRVKVDDQNAPNVYWTAPAETVRALPGLQEDTPADMQPVVNPKPANGAAFKVGDRVDTFYDENRGHNRGTVIEVKEGKYKVHYTGCAKTWDEWVDRTLVLPAATI